MDISKQTVDVISIILHEYSGGLTARTAVWAHRVLRICRNNARPTRAMQSPFVILSPLRQATRRTEERVSHLGNRIKRNGRHSLSTPFLRPRLIYKQVQGQAQTRKESPPPGLQREAPESARRRHLSMRTATTSHRARKHNLHSSLVPTSFILEVKPPITDRFLNRCCFAARVLQLVQTFMRLG